MRGKNLFGGERLLAVSGGVSRDLRGLRAAVSGLFQLLFDLLGARAGGVKVLLRVSFDLRCAASARLDFVSQVAELVGQLRLIHGCRKLLALEEACAPARRGSNHPPAR